MIEQKVLSKRLLKAWAKRLARGDAPVIPVYVNGTWIISVARGNKRPLRVVIPTAEKRPRLKPLS